MNLITDENFKNLGSCEFFKVEPFIEAANILVAADEPMRAIDLLNNLPGYYRDNPPIEVLKLKEAIYQKLATPAFYLNNVHDQMLRVEQAVDCVEQLLRGQKIYNDVKAYNDKGVHPHIVDLGPGEYWLPVGLWRKQMIFTYHDIGLCSPAKEAAMKYIGPFHKTEPVTDRPTIFVACELIEHLHHEYDIKADQLRVKADPDIIHISTPLYTFAGQMNQYDWYAKGDLGHLRTYTPQEFYDVVFSMYPTYNWELTVSKVMHMRGTKKS